MPNLLVSRTPAPFVTRGDERLARAELRRQIGRLELQLVPARRRGLPARSRRYRRRGRRSRRRGLSTSVISSGSATSSRIGSAAARGALADHSELETRNRELLELMLARPDRYQVAPDLPRRRRRARLRPLALAAPFRAARDADGLVAGEDLLRLPLMKRDTRRRQAPGAVGLVSPCRDAILGRHRDAGRRRLRRQPDRARRRRRARRDRRTRGRDPRAPRRLPLAHDAARRCRLRPRRRPALLRGGDDPRGRPGGRSASPSARLPRPEARLPARLRRSFLQGRPLRARPADGSRPPAAALLG